MPTVAIDMLRLLEGMVEGEKFNTVLYILCTDTTEYIL